MDTLTVILQGEPRELEAEELVPEESPHTGQSLRRVRVHFRVRGDETHDAVLAELRDMDSKQPLEDSEGNAWVLVDHSYSYRSDDPSQYTHRVDLREREVLQATRLEFGGLSLELESFEEELVDGMITIRAVVAPESIVDEALETLLLESLDSPESLYFPVTRVGVSPEPISMRFGRCLWEQQEGRRRHRLRFCSETGDSDEPMMLGDLHQPELNRGLEMAAANTDAMQALLQELLAAGVLDKSAIDRVVAQTDPGKDRARRSRRFDRARNIDDF